MRPLKERLVMVRLTPREKARWTAVATEAEQTLSEMIRLAVREHIAASRWPRTEETR